MEGRGKSPKAGKRDRGPGTVSVAKAPCKRWNGSNLGWSKAPEIQAHVREPVQDAAGQGTSKKDDTISTVESVSQHTAYGRKIGTLEEV